MKNRELRMKNWEFELERLVMRRPGITLLEVLSAIFITGIGLLSLLTLFPLGALKMLEAINDDSTARAGGNAKATANAVEMRLDFLAQQAMMGQTMLSPINLTSSPMRPSPDGPGWPILVDPIGVLGNAGRNDPVTGVPWSQWVAGDPLVAMVPRVQGNWLRPANPVLGLQTADFLRWCTLLDDLNFNSDGAYMGQTQDPPSWVGGIGTVQRNLRYSYAWFMRMPRSGSPNVVDLSALVFAGRSIDFVGFGTQETVIANATFVPTYNQVILPPLNGQPVDLRRGQWILDASNAITPIPNTPPAPQQWSLLSSHGFFYRIVSVSDPDAGGNVTVEVQTPLRNWPDPYIPSPNPATVISNSTVVIFDNLLEVFEDGTF
jgi:hypothetical protein